MFNLGKCLMKKWNKFCIESLKINAFIEKLWSFGKDPLDKFFIIMTLFSAILMAGLSLSIIFQDNLSQWMKDLNVKVVPVAYGSSVFFYTLANIILRASGKIASNKKRAGHIIVSAWLILAASFSLVMCLQIIRYSDVIMIIWSIGLGALGVSIASRALRTSELFKKIANNLNNNNNNQKGA